MLNIPLNNPPSSSYPITSLNSPLYKQTQKPSKKYTKPTTTKQAPEISVIMPVYNGETYINKSITIVNKYLQKLKTRYEIIIVDDGSKDKTYQKALKTIQKLNNPNIKILRYNKNQGKGHALLHGYKHSKGKIIAFYDADLDIPPQQLILLIKTAQKTNADLVITSKWHPKSKTKATLTRKFLSKTFYHMERLLLGIKVSDTQTGAKAIKRKALNTIAPLLTVKRYAFDAELITAATAQGYKIIEVPALWPIKLTSRFKIKEIWKMLIDLMAITYRHRFKKQYQRWALNLNT